MSDLNVWQGWIVAVTASNAERKTASNACAFGLKVWLPEGLDSRGRPRILFRNYLLIDTHSKQWLRLLRVRGIRRVLMEAGNENVPSRLPTSSLDRLRARQDDKGYLAFERKWNANIGDPLRVTNGVLAGQIVFYDGQTAEMRERILFSLLGHEVVQELYHDDLAPIEQPGEQSIAA